MAARGHEAILLTSHPDTAEGTRVAARHVDLGPKLGARSWPRLALQWPLLRRRLRRELAREAPFDVLLLHFKKEQLLAPRLPEELRPRLAWAEWGPVPPPLRGGPPGRLYRSAARGVEAVLAVSEGTRESLIAAGVPADRVGVVPNAIDPERFRPLPDAGAAHRRRLGIPADAFLIGCLTRFNVRKRNEVAIDAAVRLAAQPGPRRAPADDRRGRHRGRPAHPRRPARRRRPLRAHDRRRARRAAVRLRRRRLLPLAHRGRAAGDLDGHAHRAAGGGNRRRGRHRPDPAGHRRDRDSPTTTPSP